jgi:hypothetical protein
MPFFARIKPAGNKSRDVNTNPSRSNESEAANDDFTRIDSVQEEGIDITIDNVPQPVGDSAAVATKTPTSRFNNVSYLKSQNIYRASIWVDGKTCYGGQYKLEADAAYVADELGKLFIASEQNQEARKLRKLNFETFDAYQQARAIELKEKGRRDQDVGLDPSALFCKVQEMYAAFMKKVRDSSSNVMHDSNSEKIITTVDSVAVPGSVAAKQNFTSRFNGVYINKRSNKCIARIVTEGKWCNAGSYRFETDAAYAHDEGVKYLNLANKDPSQSRRGPKRKLNFASLDEYRNARAAELEGIGVSDDMSLDPSALTSKVQRLVDAFVSRQHESSPDTPSSVPNKIHESSSENIVCTKTQPNITVETGAGLGSNKVRVRHFSGVNTQKKESFGADLLVAGINFHAGPYQLESEAAYAHDYASKCFGEKLNSKTGRVTKKLNFASIEEYYIARTQELEERRLANNEAHQSFC